MTARTAQHIVEAIREAYTEGEGPVSISRRLGVSLASVYRNVPDLPRQQPRTIAYHDASWQDDAACIGCDTDEFVPDYPGVSVTVRGICGSCPVAERCLAYGLSTGSVGIWGGIYLGEHAEQRRRVAEAA